VFPAALSFLTPLILLALFSLPLIWWLLRATPPVPERLRFPAFIILRRLTNEEETPDRTPWWLLLLRLLLVAFIIIGLAGPVLNAPDIKSVDGPLVLVVDNSYAAAPGWSLRKTAIERTAEENRRTGRPVFVMTTTPAYPVGTPYLAGPLAADDLRNLATSLTPVPFPADRVSSLTTLEKLDETLVRNSVANPGNFSGKPEFAWLSDELSSSTTKIDQTFANALSERGVVTVYTDNTHDSVALHREEQSTYTQGIAFTIHANTPWDSDLVAIARDGRELRRTSISFNVGETTITTDINLPLALQN